MLLGSPYRTELAVTSITEQMSRDIVKKKLSARKMQVTETVTKSKTCLNPKPVNLRVGKAAREHKKNVLTTNQACGKVRHVSQSG